MPNTASALKRWRQSQERRARNRAAKSKIKTLTRGLLEAVESGDQEESRAYLDRLQSALDKAAKQKILHPNTVSRKKSRLAHRIQNSFPSLPPEETVEEGVSE